MLTERDLEDFARGLHNYTADDITQLVRKAATISRDKFMDVGHYHVRMGWAVASGTDVRECTEKKCYNDFHDVPVESRKGAHPISGQDLALAKKSIRA